MVVPEGWSKVRLGDKTDIYRGGSPRPINLFLTTKADGINWIKIGDVSPNSKYITSTEERIIPEGMLYSRSVYKGDFILSNSMSFGRPYILKIDGCIHDGWLTIQNYHEHFDTDFLYYILQSTNTLRQYANIAAGSSVQNLSKDKVSNITIILPPLPEQQRIAEVLSDTDLYITALEKLIAKKEAIKQGVMQELLTGKRRLKGFDGEWVKKRLGEFHIRKGSLITKATTNIGNIPVVAGGKNIVYYSNEYNREPDTITISASGANAGFVNFWKCRIFASDCSTIEKSCKYDVKFIYYALLNRQKDLYKLQTGGAQPHVQPSDISPMVMELPPTLSEQKAIAEILSDMDAEITVLKKKLAKINMMKQGMMQNLLTGKIRLLEKKKKTQPVRKKEPSKVVHAAEKPLVYSAGKQTHSKPFDDAVMIAGIVNALYSENYPLGRKKVQKCLYLLRRYQEHSTDEFKKKAAGPYADEIRYKGGEPIAQTREYIITHKSSKGTLFTKGCNIKEALEYIKRWNMQEDINWLNKKLKYKTVDTLELWATVDMAACDLENAGLEVSLFSIKNLIATNEEWRKKLERPLFSDNNIATALNELQTLFARR
ncbi:restriction endonuclease subunit S [Treponema pedis]|uniref:Restriction endonuclease subunit S n=1 Tax=Treponema pedis TaxID=409322 RepID=A0A7S7AW82_9SPIR|nr:restriction endonuclease subunit S [Treponema pedis]QOW61025.1 restriction endonuclease subunit S [Treponema pedis]